MLNNNAELDNGVYNENEEEEEKKEEDGLVGLNNPIEHKVNIPLSVSPKKDHSSHQTTVMQSLNTSQVILDEDKIDSLED